jgi:radical SAM protein with 4Fe4S-binding SPASM domain
MKINKKDFTSIIGQDESEAKLAKLHGKKYIEYRELFNKAQKLEFDSNYPLQLDFELNYSCNLSCPMCTWSTEDKKGKGKNTWFSFETYKKIISDGVKNGLKAVRLNYINEPLIRRDIAKFIRYAKDVGIVEVYLSTNGTLLTKSLAKDLIESGLTRIQVSIDAVNSETYNKIRKGGDYNEIVDNVIAFVNIRNEMNRVEPQVRVNFVKTNDNIHELDEFIDKWKNIVDLVGIQDLVGIMDNSANLEKQRDFKCTQPFYHLTIRYDGTVLPCCSFFGADIPIDKIDPDGEVNIKKIWNSKEINFIREIHSKNEYYRHPVCKKCINSTSYID